MKKARKYELFGFPFVLSIDPAFATNRQIYERIWQHVQNIYKKAGEVKCLLYYFRKYLFPF